MNITEQIQNDIKEAMKAKDREKLAALRDIKSKLLLEMTKDGSGDVDESAGMKILNKLYKQRTEAASIYKEQGREDLAASELSEAEVIKAYLPEQLSEAEIESKVAAIITDIGASSMSDMGKVMGAASQAMAGVADGKVISGIVSKLLA